MLNPARLSHRNKCVDSIEEQLKTHNVEQDLINVVNNTLNYEMEQVDRLIRRFLNAARKKVEEMRRNIPCSKEKETRRSMTLCLKQCFE